MSEQTWWDKDIKDQFLEFKSWVGDKDAPTKEWARIFVKQEGYKSLVDLGCGNATEFFAYQEEYPELEYMGVDSSQFLYEFNISKGVPMVKAKVEETGLDDGSYEIAFSRHVLEHQKDPYPLLEEMIRVGSKVAMHIFFIPPGEEEIINYDERQNLYHNTYKEKNIEGYISSFPKVKNFKWVRLGTERILIIYLN